MKIKTINQGDPDFRIINDGYLVISRSSLLINQQCPASTRYLIQQAMANGWISLQAHVPESELVWETLSK